MNVGGRGRSSSACSGSAASSSGAPDASGSGPGNGDVDTNQDDDNNDNDNYDDDSDDDDDDGNYEEPEEADAPPEDKNSRQARLLRGVVRTNEDYGLCLMTPLPDASTIAPAVFEAIELQAPTFFALRSLVRAGGFSEEDPPICFRCLRWNLTVPFSRCNRNGWTRCGHCFYIQHVRCKDVSLAGLS